MTTPRHAVLEAARMQAGMSFRDLWIGYFALGGAAEPEVVHAYLAGGTVRPMDYDVLAQAINECFLARGGNHPVPYLDELS